MKPGERVTKTQRIIVFGVLTVLVVGASAMFWKSRDNDTAVDERLFRLTLPGHWEKQPSQDPARWVYRSYKGRDQLTVSVFGIDHHLSAEEQSITLKRFNELRRRAETETSGATSITLGDTTFGESSGIQAARFSGTEQKSNRRFVCLMLCSPSSVVVVYYEAIGSTEGDSEARARAILNSVVIAGK